jgi:dTDP-4-dehydrorhamnose 3,5-epimerase-like enzyme
MLFIPVGFGHAFLGLESENILLYNIDQVYSKENDSGILWDSSSFKWPVKNPKISQRDKSFVNLKNFKSPF